MSSEEKKENEQAGGSDIEEKIDAAMAEIVDDTIEAGREGAFFENAALQEEEAPSEDAVLEDAASEETASEETAGQDEQPQQTAQPEQSIAQNTSGTSRKSARPRPITYVPIEDEDFAPFEPPVKKKHKGLKITGITAAMLIAAAGCAYAGVSYYYADKFFEGTTINGIDCSGKTAYQVEQELAGKVENYSLQVASRNLDPQVIPGEQIGYSYVSDGGVLKLLKHQKPYEWVRGLWEKRSYTASENTTYDREKLKNQVRELNCAKEENQIAPENAYVAFADTKFEIVPETEGSQLVMREVYNALSQAVSESQENVDFTQIPEVYKRAEITSESPELKATMDACNNYTKASITYTFGEETVTLDGSTIKNWLNFDDKGQLIKDDASFQQHIRDFVAQLANDHNTVGTDREFYTTSGRTVYVYGSAYGWKIDQEAETAQLTQDIQAGAQTTREPVYSMRANSHGHNDLGNTYIEVDLSDQHMYYYQDGSIIFDTDIVSGLMSYADRQTPPGIFTLYYKKSPDVLRGQKRPDGTYEYEQPVTYWMPFNGGIGFHDADWQPYFGGDRYLSGGSHGCINLPPDSAAVLYDIIQYDVPIICFY